MGVTQPVVTEEPRRRQMLNSKQHPRTLLTLSTDASKYAVTNDPNDGPDGASSAQCLINGAGKLAKVVSCGRGPRS